METYELYQEANTRGIPVMVLDIPETGSMCIQTESRCYIGMDYDVVEEEADRRVHLAHELGHCATGSFYNRWAARDIRQRHELRADKWAIEKLIPREELETAVASGFREPWELAEYFGVTEPFIRKAVCWYKQGNFDSV